MRKIPTLFVRDPADRRHVTDELTPGCEWVLAGEGVATRKYDGTCMKIDGLGRWWARREVKPGKTAPENYQLEEFDPVTGKTVGWEPVAQSPFVKFWSEAAGIGIWRPGTYELCGPKINGNPEGYTEHRLIRHSEAHPIDVVAPPTYSTCRLLMEQLRASGWEGVVWHHPDGRMAKLKVKDYAAGENDA